MNTLPQIDQHGTSTVPDTRPRLAKMWQIYTLADAYQERPPIEYVIHGLLARPSLSIVYGAPGSQKSLLLADMAECVAAGTPWLTLLPVAEDEQGTSFQTVQSPVLWIDYDNGQRRTHERFDALAKARQLPVDTPLHYVSMATPWLDASNKAQIEALADLVLYLKVQLLFIDNLGLISGEIDENSAAMARVMGNLRWLSEETNSAVILIHHQRKANGTNARLGETLRGHSSIEASLDLALLIERKVGEDQIAVIPTKVRGFYNSSIFGAYFAYTHRDGTHDLETAQFFAQPIESAEEKLHNEIRFTILSELRVLQKNHKTVNQQMLLNAVRDALSLTGGHAKVPGVNKVRGIITDMVRTGEIFAEQGERGALFYSLPA